VSAWRNAGINGWFVDLFIVLCGEVVYNALRLLLYL
jgi:hypothetical protein